MLVSHSKLADVLFVHPHEPVERVRTSMATSFHAEGKVEVTTTLFASNFTFSRPTRCIRESTPRPLSPIDVVRYPDNLPPHSIQFELILAHPFFVERHSSHSLAFLPQEGTTTSYQCNETSASATPSSYDWEATE